MHNRLTLRPIGILVVCWLLTAAAPATTAATPQGESQATAVATDKFVAAAPGTVGCDPKKLREAVATLQHAVDSGELLGAVVLAARGHSIVLHEAVGWRDPTHERAMRKDTLFRMASNTKAVTAAAILALVDDGKIALDDPAAKWLPEFADGDAAKITITHLLTHTSGLRIPTLFVSPLMKPSERYPNAPNLVLEAGRFGAIGPEVEPGTTYHYSNPGYNTLAAIVEVVSGRSFEAFCQERFYAPLGMTDSNHHESTADQQRMATVVRSNPAGDWQVRWRPGDPPTVPFVRGSGGMISTTADFTRFCRIFLDGGRAADRTILSARLVRNATKSQTPHLETISYGFGWRIRSEGVFEHGGSDGTFAWCDPGRDLVGLIFTQTQGPTTAAQREARRLISAACPTQ